MSTISAPSPIIRASGDGERRWFYGGGVQTWKLTAEQTNGTLFLNEDRMVKGKVTPLHTHPADETFYILEGAILLHMDGEEHAVDTGGVVFAPRGVPHAFMVTSDVVRLLCVQTPGSCQSFYFGASEPIADGTDGGIVDFDRIQASARENGGIEILGPPPFGKP